MFVKQTFQCVPVTGIWRAENGHISIVILESAVTYCTIPRGFEGHGIDFYGVDQNGMAATDHRRFNVQGADCDGN